MCGIIDQRFPSVHVGSFQLLPNESPWDKVMADLQIRMTLLEFNNLQTAISLNRSRSLNLDSYLDFLYSLSFAYHMPF